MKKRDWLNWRTLLLNSVTWKAESNASEEAWIIGGNYFTKEYSSSVEFLDGWTFLCFGIDFGHFRIADNRSGNGELFDKQSISILNAAVTQ